MESCALEHYVDLTHLQSWDSYKRFKYILLVGPNGPPPTCWRLGLGGKGLAPWCPLYLTWDEITCRTNIPPIVPTQEKKLARLSKVPILTQRWRWTSDMLEATMDKVEKGQLSLGKASKF